MKEIRKRLPDKEVDGMVERLKSEGITDADKNDLFDKMLLEFKFLIYAATTKVYRSYSDCGLSFKDVIADAKAVLWERIMEYDKTRSINFRRYISSAIYHYLKNLYHVEFHLQKTRAHVPLESLEMFLDNGDTDIERMLLFSYVSDYAKENFDSEDFAIYFNYYLEGHTQREVADKMHMSQSSVCNILERIRTSIRSAFNTKENVVELLEEKPDLEEVKQFLLFSEEDDKKEEIEAKIPRKVVSKKRSSPIRLTAGQISLF